MDRAGVATWRDNLPWLAWLAALAAFSLHELYRWIFIGLFFWALYKLPAILRQARHSAESRQLAVLFACIFLPMLAALAGAVDAARAGGTMARYLPYLFIGLALPLMPWSGGASRRLLAGSFAILSFWTLDGLVQFAAGVDLFGYPAWADGRLTGMFEGSPRLGWVLAVLAPVYFEGVRRLGARTAWAWLLLLPFVIAIMLGGSRASWMIFGVAVLLYFWHYRRMGFGRAAWSAWLWRGVFLAAASALLLYEVGWLGERAARMFDLLSGDYARIEVATAFRLPLWQGAAQVFAEHWLNGVGVRDFGAVYQSLELGGQPGWDISPPTHPHLLIAEIAVGTGLIGLAGYAIFLAVLWRRLRALWAGAAAADAVPWLLAALLVAFPFNSTLPFYGLFASCLMWLCIYAATLCGRVGAPR